MKIKLLLVLGLVSNISLLSFAQSPGVASGGSTGHSGVKFTLDPQLSHNFGYTEYIMDISFPTVEGNYVLKSELEFPLDVIMAGAKVGLHSTADKLYAWSVKGGYFTNLNDPGGVMKDHDWTTVRPNVVEKFSFTESPSEMSSTLLLFEGTLRVLHRKRFDLALWGGFRYQKIKQDIIGYKGWQLDTNLIRHDISGTERAVVYRVTYKSPHVGLRANIKLGARASLGARAAFAPVWASDFDDHLLRKKTATADITGSGIISGANLDVNLASKSSLKPFVTLVSDLVYFHASGNQTQSWYGDDPATPTEDDTGTVLSGIPHEINTLQINVGLRVGLTF